MFTFCDALLETKQKCRQTFSRAGTGVNHLLILSIISHRFSFLTTSAYFTVGRVAKWLIAMLISRMGG